jgi:hypothetical protein
VLIDKSPILRHLKQTVGCKQESWETLITPNLKVKSQYLLRCIFRQFRKLIKGSNDHILTNDTLSPFADTLIPIFESIKLKPSQRSDDYVPTIIDNLCGDDGNSKKKLLETFFKDGAYRAIFNFFFEDLKKIGY